MISFVLELKNRNEVLFYFSMALLLAAICFAVLTRMSTLEVNGVNAWNKPLKFALSIAFFLLAMIWFTGDLPGFNTTLFTWVNVVLFAFEMVYIAVQAGRGEASHFNQSTPFYATMYALMGLAATAATLYAAYVGYLYFTTPLPHLTPGYLWAVRLGILIFVIFSLEGAVMGSRLTHSVGLSDVNQTLPFLKWNTTAGDLRVAHFVGMHALQVLPLLAWLGLSNPRWIAVVAAFYFTLATAVLVQALQGRPVMAAKSARQLDDSI